METNAVQVKSVSTRFGDKIVHDRVSFSIKKGSVAALIGGSGSGKSVMLKEILGLLKPSSGEIEVLGVDILKADDDILAGLRKRIGVLYQNGALFSALSTGDNIAAPLREQTGLPDSIIKEIALLRLRFTGLSDPDFKKMPNELSGGMRKRAALARALALEPEVLFLDEPTSGLDSITARMLDKLIRALSDSLGLTVVIVTHDIDTLWGITDKVIVLGEGRILAEGTVGEVSESKDPWIRQYFSSVAAERREYKERERDGTGS